MLADENHIRATFDQAAEEMQRAALIAADVTRASDEFGSTAPQTKMLRELYAVAAFDAASLCACSVWLCACSAWHLYLNRTVTFSFVNLPGQGGSPFTFCFCSCIRAAVRG